MMTGEILSMRPQLAALALVACFALPYGNLGGEKAHRLSRKIPKFEVRLSGPTTVGPNESLQSQRYTALLTNRSADPQVFFVRGDYLLNANWNWSVTDAKGQPVGMEMVLNRGYCGTVPYNPNWRRLQDSNLFVLNPGESHEFAVSGPSDLYSFPTAGTYHVSVMLTYVPPNASYYFDEQGKRWSESDYERWDLSGLSLGTLEAVQNSLPFQATSNKWDLMLPAARRGQ
jgi:hypothetical protein